jgi:hypothetical protein
MNEAAFYLLQAMQMHRQRATLNVDINKKISEKINVCLKQIYTQINSCNSTGSNKLKNALIKDVLDVLSDPLRAELKKNNTLFNKKLIETQLKEIKEQHKQALVPAASGIANTLHLDIRGTSTRATRTFF